MKPTVFCSAFCFFVLSPASRAVLCSEDDARSRSSSVDTVVLPFMTNEQEIPVPTAYEFNDRPMIGVDYYEQPRAPVANTNHDYGRVYIEEDDYLPAPPKKLLHRQNIWTRLQGKSFGGPENYFEERDLFFLHAIYGSDHLLKQFEKYRELHPSEDIKKLFDIFYEMDDYPSLCWDHVNCLQISLPLSVRDEEIVKRVASVDENGNPVPIDNLIIDLPKHWIGKYGKIGTIYSDSLNDSSKPIPKDVFIRTKPKYFSQEDSEIFVGGMIYELKTMGCRNFTAIRDYYGRICIKTPYTSKTGDAAKELLDLNDEWELFHYQLKRR